VPRVPLLDHNGLLPHPSFKVPRLSVQFDPTQLRAGFYQRSHAGTHDFGHSQPDRVQVVEAWERDSDVVDAAGAGVGAYEVEDPAGSRDVEVAAAEEGQEGFFVPAFAD
jgi:hypothetical protein